MVRFKFPHENRVKRLILLDETGTISNRHLIAELDSYYKKWDKIKEKIENGIDLYSYRVEVRNHLSIQVVNKSKVVFPHKLEVKLLDVAPILINSKFKDNRSLSIYDSMEDCVEAFISELNRIRGNMEWEFNRRLKSHDTVVDKLKSKLS